MTSESTPWFENVPLDDLPAELERPVGAEHELAELYARLASQAPPSGRFARFWSLSSLPAKLAAAYGLGWVRAHFAPREERERVRAETHWRAALHALGTMGYLRGAVAKAGQVLASYPDVLPAQVLELFARLHFEAPPMHLALLAESLQSELGGELEQLFASFEPTAFAAASIGQVHRARLADGSAVAVKVQYPGMARAVRADFENLRLLLLPLCLGANWQNLMDQLAEACRMLEQETDYLREALWTERVHGELADLADVCVPRVFPQRSSARVLTTELLSGRHLAEYRATQPPQAERDRHGAALLRACMRLWCGRRLFNCDPGPGNFLFLDDGRLGLLDFGAMREFDAREWELMLLGVRAQREGGAAQAESIRRSGLADDLAPDSESFRVRSATCDWLWEPMRRPGPFDFGADEYMARGVRLFGRALRSGDTRQAPVFLWCLRQFYGVRALLWGLGARVDFHAIAAEEYARAGL